MKKNLIYDIGANIGQDTDFYLKKGYDVVAVEADPLLADGLKKNFSFQIKAGFLTVLNIGIAGNRGKIPFYVNKHNVWSSFCSKLGSRIVDFPEVTLGGLDRVVDIECFTLIDIFKEYGVPFYLKVDIEGYEYEAIDFLRNINTTLNLPTYISTECYKIEFIDLLFDLGYDKFKWINQRFVENQHNDNYKFKFGASGQFGEDLLQQWQTKEELIPIMKEYFQTPNRETNIGWFDLHGKIKD